MQEYKFKIKEIYEEYLFKFKTIVGCGSCECLPEGHIEPCDIWKKVLIVGTVSFVIGMVLI